MKPFYLFLLLCPLWSCTGQPPFSDYLGGWSGELPTTDAFAFTVLLERTDAAAYQIRFQGKEQETVLQLAADAKGTFRGAFEDQVVVHLNPTTNTPVVFIETGNHLTYTPLDSLADNQWSGTWNLFTAKAFDPTFYLSLDSLNDGSFAASTFFQSPVLHYMEAENFSLSNQTITFRDAMSGLQFTGDLGEEQIRLTMRFLSEKLQIPLIPTDYATWRIRQTDPGETQQLVLKDSPLFERMTKDILSDTLEQTHAVLIRQGGETVYEQYFDGFREDTPHDVRSVAKSFSASLVGLAIEERQLIDEHQAIMPFFSTDYPEIDWSAGKEDITLHHLLTMSSGLDAIDFGLNRMSYANEGNYQRQADWSQYILSAPMVNKPGEHANYGSGSPYLLGPILQSATQEYLPAHLHEKLLGPLGFRHYRLQRDDRGQPYFGGGWYLTARDLASFGELYLQQGNWQGDQLLPQAWVDKSIEKHLILENTFDQNPYGYLFWHKAYQIGEDVVNSIEARGTGGQYLFIVPEYELVVVILSGNYQNNKGFQPERIMRAYILPSLVKR